MVSLTKTRTRGKATFERRLLQTLGDNTQLGTRGRPATAEAVASTYEQRSEDEKSLAASRASFSFGTMLIFCRWGPGCLASLGLVLPPCCFRAFCLGLGRC